MKTRILSDVCAISMLVVVTGWLLNAYRQTPEGRAAQMGYSCGYTAGIYKAIAPATLESSECLAFRRTFQIHKDGAK